MKIRLFLFFLFYLISFGNGKSQPVQTVDTLDIKRFSGRWFEIASCSVFPEKECRCVTNEYEIEPGKNYFRVTKRCIRFENGRSRIVITKSRAYPVKETGNAHMRIKPSRSSGDDYIIGMANDYSWALIGSKDLKYLRIISRDSFMPGHIYNEILNVARKKGIEVKGFIKTPVNCDIGE